MKKRLLLLLCACLGLNAAAQVTLDDCRKMAGDNYPAVRQYRLIEQTRNFNLTNASRGNLPQIALSGKASYQSDVPALPVSVPGIEFDVPKDQYQVMVEIRQNVWDGGEIRNRRMLTEASADEAARQTDVSMYALNERVDQVFFGILMIDEQLRQNDLLHKELERNLRNVTAYRDNGIANDADVDAVSVEMLNNRQQRSHLEAVRGAYVRSLALLTGADTSAVSRPVRPEMPHTAASSTILRPELNLFDARLRSIDVRQKGLQTGYMPRFSLFAQGGYGNPGLNFLKDKFEPFYVVGARLSWNFGSLYTLKNDRRKLEVERESVETERDLFLFNTRLQIAEQDGTLASLRKQMEADDEIIRLRTNIRKSAEAKVANGTLSVNEMLRELNAESIALQTKAVHGIQLLAETYRQRHLTNQ